MFQLGSKVYHSVRSSFRSCGPEAPSAVRRSIAHAKRIAGDDPGDYYEFGLYRGFTYWTAFVAARDEGLDRMRFYGFDSFRGLPDVKDIDRAEGRFFKGQFCCSRPKVEHNLRTHGMDMDRADLIEGYYADVLTDDLRAKHPFRKAAVVMLDCDLYESTSAALDWVSPYVGDKSVIILDDWGSFHGGPDVGQPRAWREWLERHPQYRFERLFEYQYHGLVVVLHKL